MAEHIYTVAGMTCAHCVAAVTAEVSAIPQVEEVAVELESGRVTVQGDGVQRESVKAAVEGAGYSLA